MAGGVRLSMVTLDAADPQRLAAFYERLLGWTRDEDSPEWVTLPSPDGGVGLAFKREPLYRPPVWPARPEHQQMMAHLEIGCDDLAAAVEHAEAAGATVAEHQPQDDVRVCLDPAGHPFCLWLPG